jgi:hypothetical protein
VQTYRRKEQATVVAVRIDLDTDGLSYRKWGGIQRAKRGDWLVDNDGDVYTVEADTFEQTYREIGRGVYRKIGNVWATRAETAGTIKTKEGATAYAPGDYLVFNDADGRDGYAMKEETFHRLYEEIAG